LAVITDEEMNDMLARTVNYTLVPVMGQAGIPRAMNGDAP